MKENKLKIKQFQYLLFTEILGLFHNGKFSELSTEQIDEVFIKILNRTKKNEKEKVCKI